MSVYYKYAPDGSRLVVLYYVDECVYWYTYEELVKWFVDLLGKIFHMKFLGYAHWFMSFIISQLQYHSISLNQDRCTESVVSKYLATVSIK